MDDSRKTEELRPIVRRVDLIEQIQAVMQNRGLEMIEMRKRENKDSYVFIDPNKSKRFTIDIGETDTGRYGFISEHEIHSDKKNYINDVLHYRNKEKLSQMEIATKLGISQSYVSKILKENK